jgi:molecular chaperone GrpE
MKKEAEKEEKNGKESTENQEVNADEIKQSTSEEQLDPVKALEARIAELNDKYTRLYSDFENYKKRAAKERVDLLQYASAEMMREILPVVDDFERAVKVNATANELKSVIEGVNIIYNKFVHFLKQKGIEEMKADGASFDPDLHEAITNVPAPSDDKKGKVLEVVEKGYHFNGKVLRYAKVVVGS